MNPELLKKLAAFVGVEAGADGSLDALAVKAAMQTLIDKVSAKEDAPPTGEAPADAQPTLPDLAQLRAALGLPADADNAAIAAQLQSLLNMLLEPAPEGMSGKSYDFASLQGAMALAAKSAPPLPSGIPAVHRGADKPGEKNRQYGSVNFNRGAKKPGLADMVNDLLAGKSATYQTGVLGGYVVREEVRDELLPLLRSKLVLEQAGATVTMMPDFAALDVPKMTKAPAAYWVGANQDVPEDDAEYGTMKLVPKQIASIARIPMRLLQIAPAQVEQRIRDEITTSIRLKIDYAGLYGTGAITGSNNGAEPLGLVNMTGVTKTTLATNGRAPVPKDMSDAKKRVEADNVELDASAHWLYHPNVLNYFEDLTDTTGQLLNKSQWQKGYAPLTTTQIPTNLTTGSSNDTTDIFFGRWNYLEMGLGNQIEIMVLDQLYARSLQVGIMAYTYADFIAHYPEAFDVIRGVRIA